MKKEVLKNGYFVYTDDEHRFTLDALILAELCPPFNRSAELCSGTGVIGFSVLKKGNFIDLVEISPLASSLISKALNEQSISNARLFCEDARVFSSKNQQEYDLVLFNPPYYRITDGIIPQNEAIASQKFELQGTLEEFILAAKQLLTDNGRLLFCIKPYRKTEVLRLIKKCGFFVEHIYDVHHSEQKDSFLTVFSVLKTPCDATQSSIFLNQNGSETPFYKNLYKFEDK
ncbi:MAG: methyltransferase [Clostridia bacterium]|nr:methyltransferase [Clostridia bacterium]